MNTKILFITGHRKSGTTMFANLFDGHEDFCVYPSDLTILYAFYPNFIGKNFSSLKYPDKKDLYNLCDKIFLNKTGFAGNDYYVNKISNEFKIKKEHIINGKSKLTNYNQDKESQVKLVNSLTNDLESIN